MYIIRSETFIEIDSLRHLKISRQTYPTNLSKIYVTASTVLTLCNASKIMRTIHTSMTSTFQGEFRACLHGVRDPGLVG